MRHNETFKCVMMVAWTSGRVRAKQKGHTTQHREHENRETPTRRSPCSALCAHASKAAECKVLPQGARNAGRGRSGFFGCEAQKMMALPSSFAAGMEGKNEKW